MEWSELAVPAKGGVIYCSIIYSPAQAAQLLADVPETPRDKTFLNTDT